MKNKLLIGMFLAGSTVFGQVSFGFRIGPPPAPRVVRVRPPAPGPGYNWIDGYWYPVNGRYTWHSGYWTRPPYSGANWIGPRYEGGQFFQGYWGGGGRDRFEHNHQWDRNRNRDYDRDDHKRH